MKWWMFSEYMLLAGTWLGFAYRFDSLRHSLIGILVLTLVVNALVLMGLLIDARSAR